MYNKPSESLAINGKRREREINGELFKISVFFPTVDWEHLKVEVEVKVVDKEKKQEDATSEPW